MRSWLKRGADAVGAGLFAALFLTFIVQITARFGFNRPLPWTDELAVILYVWVIMWAAAFMVRAGSLPSPSIQRPVPSMIER